MSARPRTGGPLLGGPIAERRPESCRDFSSDEHRDEPAWPAWLVAVLIAAAFVLAPIECYLLEQMPAVEVDVTQPEKVEA